MEYQVLQAQRTFFLISNIVNNILKFGKGPQLTINAKKRETHK